MAYLSDFLKSSTARGALGEPGSNGFWRREIYSLPGTYTWTAAKSGRVKIQAIGAASGRSFDLPGNPGHYGDKLLDVVAGQTLTIVVGKGSAGVLENFASAAGGTTSISGVPVGGTPLVLPGAPGVQKASTAPSNSLFGTPTFPSGPWDRSFPGGVGSVRSVGCGGPASASPFGPGMHSDPATGAPAAGQGGHGWGGRSFERTGASSFGPGTATRDSSAPGRTARSGTPANLPETMPWWDLSDVDSAGGSHLQIGTQTSRPAVPAGAGAGGAASDGLGAAPSALGGGSGFGNSVQAVNKSGNGAGGAPANNNQAGGEGGDAFVMIFWDEVF